MRESDFVAELEAALATQENPQDALTVREWGKILGLEPDAVRRRLHMIGDLGRLEVCKKASKDLAGNPIRKNAYRILPA